MGNCTKYENKTGKTFVLSLYTCIRKCYIVCEQISNMFVLLNTCIDTMFVRSYMNIKFYMFKYVRVHLFMKI